MWIHSHYKQLPNFDPSPALYSAEFDTEGTPKDTYLSMEVRPIITSYEAEGSLLKDLSGNESIAWLPTSKFVHLSFLLLLQFLSGSLLRMLLLSEDELSILIWKDRITGTIF